MYLCIVVIILIITINNMVDKYTMQVLDFLRNTSKEIKEAEWDRISNLGLPNIGAFTFVEDAMFDIKC